MIGNNRVHLYFISVSGYRGTSVFFNVYADDNETSAFPAIIDERENHIQAELSDRLGNRDGSSILSAENTLKDIHFRVKFISSIQMHELQTFISANGNGLKGEFVVSKDRLRFFIFFLVKCFYSTALLCYSFLFKLSDVYGLLTFC